MSTDESGTTGPEDRQPAFDVIPAIDLRDGRVVRWMHGRPGAETVYGTDPAATASSLAEAGARWLHVVDLDGALAGRPRQLGAVRRVVAAVGDRAAIELGGGLRTVDDVDAALSTGIRRVVIGTGALRDPAFASGLVKRIGSERVFVAIDVRGGRAVGEGWRDGATGRDVTPAIRVLAAAGVGGFEVTAIDRDGTLDGPDLPLLTGLTALGIGRILASGGIASLADLEAIRAAGCGGAIVGRAIYEGRLDLEQAIARMA